MSEEKEKVVVEAEKAEKQPEKKEEQPKPVEKKLNPGMDVSNAKAVIESPAEKKKAEAEKMVYVFKGSGRHGSEPFKKGDEPKGFSPDVIKGWLANGVLISKKEFDALEAKKKNFANKK